MSKRKQIKQLQKDVAENNKLIAVLIEEIFKIKNEIQDDK